MQIPRFPAVLVLLTALTLSACKDEASSARRTWTPADHAQPPGREVDPSRIPGSAAAPGASEGDPIERAAAALYLMRCASCHGRDGQGGGPELPPGATPPSFADPAWQEGIADEAIVAVIRDGRNLMPAFAQEIAPEGIQALVAHLRRLGGS